MRRKMNQIIKWLETDGFSAHQDEIQSPEYAKALRSLIDTGCVTAYRTWGGKIVKLSLNDHYATYQLERHDLWVNRIVSFLIGVATTVAAGFLLHILL